MTQRYEGGTWSPHSYGWRKYGWCCASVHPYLQKHKVNKLLFDLIHTTTGERIPLPKKRIISSRSSSMKSRTRLAASVYKCNSDIWTQSKVQFPIASWISFRYSSSTWRAFFIAFCLLQKNTFIFTSGPWTPQFASSAQLLLSYGDRIVTIPLHTQLCIPVFYVSHPQRSTFPFHCFFVLREKLRNAARNNSCVSMAWGWHQVAHMTDAVVMTNSRHISVPIAHFLNIKLLQSKLVMTGMSPSMKEEQE